MSALNATVLLTEDFNYTAGTAIREVDGWTTAGTLTTGDGRVTNATTLEYSNAGGVYGHSGSKSLKHNYSDGSNYISTRGFSRVSSGAVYLTYMYKADGNQNQAQSELLGLSNSPTNPSARPWIGKLTSGDTSGATFRFGLTLSSGSKDDIKWASGEYSKNDVLLIVLKYDITNKETKLFINPTLGTAEEPEADVTDNTGSSRSRIDTLMFRNNGNSKSNYYIGGIRVSTTWAEAVRAVETPSAGIAKIETDFYDGTWGEIATSAYTSGSYPSSTINGFQLTAAGMQNGSITYTETPETFRNRISMDKASNGGSITFPVVNTVQTVNVYASAGSENTDLKLQNYNYRTGLWEDVATYHFEAKATCYKFFTVLNANISTRLRIANADGSTKYVWKIETVPTVTKERIIANFSDDDWSTLSSSYTTATVNEVDFTSCSRSTGTNYAVTGERFTARINVNNLTNNGMMELPAVVSAAGAEIYASAGTANKDMKVQKYNYYTDAWDDVETLNIATNGVYYRFMVAINSESIAKLRLVNVDGSAKQILKVVTYANQPTILASPTTYAATNISAHSFTTTWSLVSGATGYRVIRYDSEGKIQRVETVGENITTLTFKDTGDKGVKAATDYSYSVVAIGDGETTADSDPSTPVDVTTASEIMDTYTRSVTNGNYGTICLPKVCEDLSAAGGVFFAVAGKILDGGNLSEVVLDEVTSLGAGVPYVFLATASELNIPLTGDAVAEPDNSGSNGLIGSFTTAKVSSSVNNYILSNNLLYCAKNHTYNVGENRAYFDISAMSEFGGVAPAPGMRRVRMVVQEQQSPTSVDEALIEKECGKMLIDGQLVIIHNGVKYNLVGSKIK